MNIIGNLNEFLDLVVHFTLMFTSRERIIVMNKQPPIREATLAHNEQFLLERALRALRMTTGLEGKAVAVEHDPGEGLRPDAGIEIDVGGKPHRYAVAIKRVDRFAAIGQIKNQLDRLPQPGLLVARRITTETADVCRKLDVQFIDAHGNAYLHAPGLFVLVTGQRLAAKEDPDSVATEPPRAGTPTALRVIFTLLCQPELLNAPYRAIKQAAGVALGALGWVFQDLNHRGFTTGGNKGDRHLLERKRLIDEWVTNYPIKLRPRLNPKRFHAPDPNWWQQVDITRYEAQWGGEVAADKLTGHLKANTVTVYMRPNPHLRQNLTKLVSDNQLRADPAGEIEILETFWDFPPDAARPDIVPPLLVHADLLATLDPRNFTVARMILEQHLHAPETPA